MLYTRQILILLVNLYTVRVVLNALGVEDYGIYNVVGGVVLLFSFLGNAMTSATQRFYSFALGQNNLDRLKVTFIVNLIIYGIIALVAVVLLETVGLWFVSERLHLPPDRFNSACLVYHFSVLVFIATIVVIPFNSIIVAHEDMKIYAYISIAEALMKLSVAFFLVYLPWDKLELYSMLVFVVSVTTAIIYTVTCMHKYKECRFHKFYWNKELFIEIICFTGWTLFGQVSTVFRRHAVTILLNQVFSPAIVAARAIATNITAQTNIFSANFNTGLYPPIIKLYACGNKREMFSLVFNGAKLTFFLMWVFALPMFFGMDAILHIWLKNPPPEAALFSRLALVEVLITSISLPIYTLARAPGQMKTYELILGSIQIAIFFVSWYVLKMGGAAYSVYVVAIVANLVMFIIRLLIVRMLVGLPLSPFFHQVIVPVLGVALLSAVPSFAIYLFLPNDLAFTGISVLSGIIFSSVSMYYIGLDKVWRGKIRSIIANYFRLFRRVSD